jgi:DNA-binding transcriptional MerR regulator
MSIFNEFKGFWGTGAELSERAKVMSRTMGLKTEKLTERLIRYYAAEGVLDKPDRLGREAAYHFRHLLQLLIARRLVDEGVSLVAISKFNLNKTTDELEKALLNPSKDEAKAVTEKYREEAVTAKENPVVSEQPISVAEVLSQLNELKQNMSDQSQELKQARYQVEYLLKELSEVQRDIYKRIENDQAKMKEMVMSTLDRMEHMAMRQNKEIDYQLSAMNEQAAITQKEVMALLKQQYEQRLFSK